VSAFGTSSVDITVLGHVSSDLLLGCRKGVRIHVSLAPL